MADTQARRITDEDPTIELKPLRRSRTSASLLLSFLLGL